MFVCDSKLKSSLEEVYSLSYGRFYFFESFIVTEICEGIHFTWEMGQEVIALAIGHYGREQIIGFITNKVHSYSCQPQDWVKFFESNYMLSAFAVVDYNYSNSDNTLIEKIFFESKIQKFRSLETAVDWVEKHTPTRILLKELD